MRKALQLYRNSLDGSDIVYSTIEDAITDLTSFVSKASDIQDGEILAERYKTTDEDGKYIYKTLLGMVAIVDGNKHLTIFEDLSEIRKIIIDNELVTEKAIERLNTSAGFNEFAEYQPQVASCELLSTTTNVVDGMKKIVEALDNVGGSEWTDGQIGITNDTVPYSATVGEDELLSATTTVVEGMKKMSETIVDNELVTEKALETINSSVGLDEHAKYVPQITDCDFLEGTENVIQGLKRVASAITEMGDSEWTNEQIGVHAEDSGYTTMIEGNELLGATENVIEGLKKVSETIIDNELVTEKAIEQLNTSAGFNEFAEYEPMVDDCEFLKGTQSVVEGLKKVANELEHAGGSEWTDEQIGIENNGTPYSATVENDTLLSASTTVVEGMKKISETVVDNELVTEKALEAINTSAGFDEHAKYDTQVVDYPIIGDTKSVVTGMKALADAIQNKKGVNGEWLTEQLGVEYDTESYTDLVEDDEVLSGTTSILGGLQKLGTEMIKDELVTEKALERINLSVGLTENAEYEPQVSGNTLLSGTSSVVEALTTLSSKVSFTIPSDNKYFGGCTSINDIVNRLTTILDGLDEKYVINGNNE